MEPEDKPAYIGARMSLAGANATTMAKPEKIQQLQASLACTLRMPLENIRIQNITVTDAAGVKRPLGIDPTQYAMAGDGSTNCYDMRNVTGARRLRALAAATGSVDVDYTIVAPSDEILAMDTTQFNEVVSTSPILLDIAASVGSSGVTASAVETSVVNAPVTSPSSSPSPIEPHRYDLSYYIGGGLGGLAAFVGLVTALFFMYNENRRAKRKAVAATTPTANPRVVVMYEGERHTTNPLSRMGVMRAESTRIDYGPEAARRSLTGQLRPTHGTAV
jgi:hypothetical protein